MLRLDPSILPNPDKPEKGDAYGITIGRSELVVIDPFFSNCGDAWLSYVYAGGFTRIEVRLFAYALASLGLVPTGRMTQGPLKIEAEDERVHSLLQTIEEAAGMLDNESIVSDTQHLQEAMEHASKHLRKALPRGATGRIAVDVSGALAAPVLTDFDVGDRVLIVKKVDPDDGGVEWIAEMDDTVGEIGVVIGTSADRVLVELPGEREWLYHPEALVQQGDLTPAELSEAQDRMADEVIDQVIAEATDPPLVSVPLDYSEPPPGWSPVVAKSFEDGTFYSSSPVGQRGGYRGETVAKVLAAAWSSFKLTNDPPGFKGSNAEWIVGKGWRPFTAADFARQSAAAWAVYDRLREMWTMLVVIVAHPEKHGPVRAVPWPELQGWDADTLNKVGTWLSRGGHTPAVLKEADSSQERDTRKALAAWIANSIGFEFHIYEASKGVSEPATVAALTGCILRAIQTSTGQTHSEAIDLRNAIDEAVSVLTVSREYTDQQHILEGVEHALGTLRKVSLNHSHNDPSK